MSHLHHKGSQQFKCGKTTKCAQFDPVVESFYEITCALIQYSLLHTDLFYRLTLLRLFAAAGLQMVLVAEPVLVPQPSSEQQGY